MKPRCTRLGEYKSHRKFHAKSAKNTSGLLSPSWKHTVLNSANLRQSRKHVYHTGNHSRIPLPVCCRHGDWKFRTCPPTFQMDKVDRATRGQSKTIEKTRPPHQESSWKITSGLLPPRRNIFGIAWANLKQWRSVEKTRLPHRGHGFESEHRLFSSWGIS